MHDPNHSPFAKHSIHWQVMETGRQNMLQGQRNVAAARKAADRAQAGRTLPTGTVAAGDLFAPAPTRRRSGKVKPHRPKSTLKDYVIGLIVCAIAWTPLIWAFFRYG